MIKGKKMRKVIKFALVGILFFSFLAPVGAQEAGQGGGQETERTIVDVLKAMFPQAIIEVDPITSTLVVTAPPPLQKKIDEVIAGLDVYHPQITIEAKFIELTVNDINELGIDTDISNIIIREAKGIKAAIDTTWGDSDTSFPQEAGAWELWYTRISNTKFTALLRALEKQKKANVLSAPKVTTLNGQPATIEITRTVPYVSELEISEAVSGGGQQINYTIETKDAGIYLEVTPRVAEGSTLITLDIKPTVRELIQQLDIFTTFVPTDLGWPVIDERITNTSMVIDSGQVVVMGGLIKEESSKVEKKTPLLGDIPLLGYAFRHTYSQNEKKNLLIFVTAYLLSPSGEKTVAKR